MKIQITLDCTDPHQLVEFWAAALGYRVEDHTAIIDGLLAAGHLPAEAVVPTTVGKGFRDLAACSDPGNLQPRLLLQRVPEAKTA
ncbi:VOC family protein, partial [Xanthomonas citri pv. citri]